ncbi:NAD(P)-binding protein [Cenococcum geophilum 1.58]|uniref:NAD(P)-binding protein n=1 Tax=Cenococcum geophilum 1.58 TaxID=794803 RepID=UPI00358F09AB|nr:NAD(P)-binding protein [Cenococcum geophilum 1.58]
MSISGISFAHIQPLHIVSNKRAIVTGGDSGIGRSISILFAMGGADDFIVYLPEEEENAQETKRRVEKYGRKCHLMSTDLKDRKNCKTVVDNASTANPPICRDQWIHTFNTNIHPSSTWPNTRSRISLAVALSSNNASMNAYIGRPDLLDYTSTKSAIISFTRGLSNQYVGRDIRVNAIAPGPRSRASPPMGRPARPSKIATCFVFLASMDSLAISGQTLHPNGGVVVNG